MLTVAVNGSPVGSIPWRAVGELDVTCAVREGLTRIDIEATGSLRNMRGPFLRAAGRPVVTDAAAFTCEGRDFTPGYQLHPYGLMEPVGIYYAG